MTPRALTGRALLNNTVWLVSATALAFMVWMTATLQNNPVQERPLDRTLPVQLLRADNILVTNASTDVAQVLVRAPASVFNVLAPDDIQVVADLTAVGPGTHTVLLEARTARQADVVDISPRQVTVTLEERQEKLVPVDVQVVAEPPTSYRVENITRGATQVRVTGPASVVSQVTLALVELDLSERRSPFDLDVRPRAITADGTPAQSVAMLPTTVSVRVDIAQRADVAEVRITPNFSLPAEGYTLTAFDYNPKAIIVTGPPELLASLPGTFFTAPVDLSQTSGAFQLTVAVQLPDPRLVPLTPQQITVTGQVNALESSRQFDALPVQLIGLAEGLRATVVPGSVNVLVSGPQPVLAGLEADRVRVIVDANGLTEPGTYQLAPIASITGGDFAPENIAVLPPVLDVTITSSDAP